MKLKVFITASVSLFIIVFPQNIIGCAGGDDPYDYYKTFFSSGLSGDPGMRPFFYTALRFMHGEQEGVSTKEATSAEWAAYTNNEATKKDVQQFVLKYEYKQLSNLYYHLEKNQPLSLPDSVKQNSFTKWLMKTKDLEALGYLMYAKQVEPYVTGDEDPWADITRDKEKMSRLIKNGTQLWKAAKKDFIKLRYGYQTVRLAHYSEQYENCIGYYNSHVAGNTTQSILQQLSLALKAGAMKHTGKREEAAYEFSKVFAKDGVKRRSNYLSFYYTTRTDNGMIEKENVLKYCKNNSEKATVTGMYAISNPGSSLQEMKEMYKYDPASPLLELIAIREINKLEDDYLGPTMGKEKTGTLVYAYYQTGWDDKNFNADNAYAASTKTAKEVLSFCHQLAQDNKVPNRSLFEIAAAYTAYMMRDMKQAKTLLAAAGKLNPGAKVKDQLMLTNLLVTISEQKTIDAAFEEQLLPSVQWIEKKAKDDDEWKIFYRNLLNDILAWRYHQQQDAKKEVLCIGAAEKIMYVRYGEGENEYYGSRNAISFLRDSMNSKEVEQLHALMHSSSKTKWETYLTANNSFSKDDVSDVAGTANLRELDYNNAERWLKQVSAKYYKVEPYTTYMVANPFADLLYDTHAPTNQDTEKYTKLSFVQKMKQLNAQSTTGNDEQKAKTFFQMANGLYQMSYWGNSWMLVAYGWSGNDGLNPKLKQGSWEREYYGVYKAEAYYLKARSLTKDVNLKARCTWMAAKCAQKQADVPTYETYKDYDAYEKASAAYAKNIRINKYFKEFAGSYGNTAVYKEVFNSCVYLKDYVNKK